ncbi:MAG TPA: hypothetical protein VK788_25975 [Terriglobales bacterium]|jgi:hypothetical protein|nr:hypothetical protein [Terriglobales bacterium]
MSAAEPVAGTFFYGMKFDPKDPNSPDMAQRRFFGPKDKLGFHD